MKKNTAKKLRINLETLRYLNPGTVRGGEFWSWSCPETRGFTNCAYCMSTPETCPTSIYTVDNNCIAIQM